jgi:hypothetical protein
MRPGAPAGTAQQRIDRLAQRCERWASAREARNAKAARYAGLQLLAELRSWRGVGGQDRRIEALIAEVESGLCQLSERSLSHVSATH